VVRAPSNGAGHQPATGARAATWRRVRRSLTFVDSDAVWIEAELRENSLELIKVGDPVGIVLDVRPGRVYPGKVESVGWGIDNRDTDQQTGLPTVKQRQRLGSRAPAVRGTRPSSTPKNRPTRHPGGLAGQPRRLHRNNRADRRRGAVLDPARVMAQLSELR
jgi:hypothetical protein